MILTGNAEGFGRPPANDIIPGIWVIFNNSLISDARKRVARFE
jgi:hypothetical protein